MELGLATFADLAAGASPQQRMRELMEEVELADQLGLDVFAIGEHHRPDYLISSPAVVLGAAAVRTQRIRLSSAVTVLSSDDPSASSSSSPRWTCSRAAARRSWPAAARSSSPSRSSATTWTTTTTSTPRSSSSCSRSSRLHGRHVVRPAPPGPRARRGLAAARAGPAARLGRRRRLAAVRRSAPASLGLPLTLAHHRRPARAVRPLVDLYREAFARAGHDPADAKVAINTHAFVGRDSQRPTPRSPSPTWPG
jgi:hypothetical protein